jgi:alpha-tubulin suppressor-like RCC1 family protein
MVAARKRGTIRLARSILILLAGVVGVSGLAATAGASSRPSVEAGTLANVVAVASNSDSGSYCALLSTGRVDCWGANGSGQLGNGTATESDVPVAVLGITDAKAVASDNDGNSFCAVLSTGHMKCWGDNTDGELGNGTTTTSDIPVAVKNITAATAVVGGAFGGAEGFCALLSTSHVDCWGYNADGELGNGTTTNSDVPVAVHQITNAASLISGYAGFCALLATSHVDCWGYNANGELGNGTTTNSDVPVAVAGITDATAVASATSGGTSCALLSTGHVKCWGNNDSGQLGNGTMTGSDVPVAVLGITDAKAVGGDNNAGSFCAVLSTGHMKCWGDGTNGQLGNGAMTTFSVPVSVKNVTTATAVIGGNSNFCALLSTKHLDCWGYGGDGELGNGTFGSSDAPVAVRNITSAAGLISGSYSYCALLSTSHVDCWGDGGNGQLGNGSFSGSDVPVAVLAAS